MPKVSVLVPMFNCQEFLPDLIDSLKKQVFTDFEVILVDDGSTDNSLEIARRLTQGDHRFVILHIVNSGQSVARKFALSHATGEYIAFADSDDIVADRWLSAMTNLLESGADIAVAGFKYYYPKSGKKLDSRYPIQSHDAMGPEITSEWLLDEQFQGFLWNKLFKKELFDQVDLTPNFNFMEDIYIIGQIIPRISKVSFCAGSYYLYRQNEDSKMHSKLSQSDLLAYQTLGKYYQTFTNTDYQILAIKRYIKLSLSIFERFRLGDWKKYKKTLVRRFSHQLRKENYREAITLYQGPTRFFLRMMRVTGQVRLLTILRKELVELNHKITRSEE